MAELPAAQQAGILCNDPRFQDFAATRCGLPGKRFSASAAAQRLRVTEAAILRKYGHLRNIAPNRSVVATSTKGAKRGGGGAVLARGVTLDRAVFEAGKDVDFRHAETTPAGRNHMVGARVSRRPDTRIDTVIETIRACRDEYLREKQP